jgi:hypothetical protein
LVETLNSCACGDSVVTLAPDRAGHRTTCNSGSKGRHILCQGRQASEPDNHGSTGPQGRHLNPKHRQRLTLFARKETAFDVHHLLLDCGSLLPLSSSQPAVNNGLELYVLQSPCFGSRLPQSRRSKTSRSPRASIHLNNPSSVTSTERLVRIYVPLRFCHASWSSVYGATLCDRESSVERSAPVGTDLPRR